MTRSRSFLSTAKTNLIEDVDHGDVTRHKLLSRLFITVVDLPFLKASYC